MRSRLPSPRLWMVMAALGVSATACASDESPESQTAESEVAAAPEASANVIRLDPDLDALVPADATVEKVADGFQFTEGPLWRPSENRLWFSDVVGNVLRAVTPEGEVEVLMEQAGGPTTAPPGSFIGPNGLLADSDGTVLMAQHANRQIVRIGPDLETTVVVDRFEGDRLNSPNDLTWGPGGALYFTDPPYGLTGQDEDPAKELDFNGVFRLEGDQLTAVVRDLGRPNGIAFSPDQGTMYVANTEPDRKVIMAYDVAADGSVSNGRVFADGTADATPGMPDGIKLDTDGNVYATMPGGVWVLAPDGRHLGTIHAPEVAANIGWGDDGSSLYITAETGIYRVRLTASGY